jgi:hypothetical protein
LNTATATALRLDPVSDTKLSAPPKPRYKSIPESYKALSETKFRRVVSDLESVLLDISADGIGVNTPDGRISTATLNSWAEQLRDALETLSKGQ